MYEFISDSRPVRHRLQELATIKQSHWILSALQYFDSKPR